MMCDNDNVGGGVLSEQPPWPQQLISLSSRRPLEDMLKELVDNTLQFQEEMMASILELQNKYCQLTTVIKQLKAKHSPPLSPKHKEMPEENVNTVMVRSDIVVEETQEETLDDLKDLVARFEQETLIYHHNIQSSREMLDNYMENLRRLSLTFEQFVPYKIHHHEETVVMWNNDVYVVQDLLKLKDDWDIDKEGKPYDQLGDAYINSIIDDFLSVVEGSQTPSTDLPTIQSDDENKPHDQLDVYEAITIINDLTSMVDISHPPPLSESCRLPPSPIDAGPLLLLPTT
ncbi:hypothetical protein PanWU01x14_108560 [Parasponia andersonii]|uniref:Uncharacterized protein n=1 Tax=Parasponia andersonii TaxID=3476 RepID=A0A2P5CZY7_PARAD|nr:hypothetical protein PanWU01x14_108560 [Parasponia andersonii]